MTIPLRHLSAAEAATLPPMIIDSFAGGGGASTGIELALGRSPDVAINHSAEALALHAANHPETLHLDSNIWDVDPREIARGRRVGLLWASPDCKHFSKAKGGAPRDRNIRDLAWVVVDWAEKVQPDVILLENVEEFRTWGPLDIHGQPIKEFAGLEFERWMRRLKRAGYRVQWRELRACDYGAPTIRKRFFMVARRDGRRITWPKPTHGDPASAAVRKGKLLPWRTAAECIDWSLPCPSIFDTSAEVMAKHGLRAIRPLAENTLARVARGMKRYVLDAERPFLVNLTHGGRVEDAAAPVRTITGAHRGEKAVVVPSMMSLKGTDRRDSRIDVPHPTVLAGGGHSALLVPHLATMRNSQKPWQGADEPTHTVTAGGAGLTLIAPSLQRFNGGATGADLREPAPTVTANSYIKRPGGAAPLGIIAPVLTYAQQGGHNRLAEAPHHTITASNKDQNSVMVAGLVQTGYGERPGQQPRALDPQAPLGTVVAGGAKHAPLAAFLAQQNGGPRMEGFTGRPATTPASTITASGSQQTPVAAFLTKYYGQGTGATLAEPCHTVTVDDRFGHIQASLEAPPFTRAHEARARQVADFLRAHDAWEGGEFVTLTIDGGEFIVVDIGLRMLTPRELFTAQGFPADYVIEGVWDEGTGWEMLGHNGGPTFREFPKNVQVSCCGNSVCPPLAEALVHANCAHLAVETIPQQEVRHAR